MSCGELRIMGNKSLASITGLNNLTIVDGNVHIGHYYVGPNPYLKHLSGFSNLEYIDGDLNIDRNYILENLSGLDNLLEIGGSLILGTGYGTFYPVGNLQLEDISALSNLSLFGNLEINSNYSLSTCQIQSICEYLAAPSGLVIIENNAAGCNSPEEVIDSCIITTIEDKILNESFAINPNPVGSSALIEYTLQRPSLVTLQILDVSGRKVAILVNDLYQQGKQNVLFDASNFKSGIYFCTLKTNNPEYSGQTIKIMKL
jgi:hypothetical protein